MAPPYIPYAPARARAGVNLARVLWVHAQRGIDGLWAAEQSLCAGTCAAVLAWPTVADTASLRRLQLAAEAGNALGILFRTERAAMESSPAALRLRLEPDAMGLRAQVLKRRGGWPAGPVLLSMRHALAVHSVTESRARDLHPR